MCTASLIPIDAGYRLVHSRDEQRDRSPAEPPVWRSLPAGISGRERVRALAPLDPDGGGTWIATDHTGRTVAIMNANPPRPDGGSPGTHAGPDASDRSGASPPSRGVLAGLLLRAGGWPPDDARLRAQAALMRPHRAVVIEPVATPGDPPRVAVWSGGAGERGVWTDSAAPNVWVSSGLGDDRVSPRIELFDRLVAAEPSPDAQDAFHRHRWAQRPEISVLMERDTARTVSVLTVELVPGRARMLYQSVEATGGLGPPEVAEAPAWA